MPTDKALRATFLALASLAGGATLAGAHSTGAHVHGEAQAAIVVSGSDVSISLTSAMYNITGFERAPRNAEEDQILSNAIAALEDGGALFSFDEGAGCRLTTSSHSLPAADEDPIETVDHDEDHNPYRDLEASFDFTCAAPSRLRAVTFNLIPHFENLEKVDVVAFVNERQAADELTRQQITFELPIP